MKKHWRGSTPSWTQRKKAAPGESEVAHDQALRSDANWRKYHKLRSTEGRFEPRVFRTIAKALHPDPQEKCSKAELDEAARLFLELRPMFED
jgi:hypothetical protein